MSSHLTIAVGIFSITYMVIMSEKLHRTVVALFGAVLMLLFSVEGQEQAVHHIDANTIGLLIGMMIIVSILKRTGIFEYLAIRSAKIAEGDPWKILVMLSGITAISSALLDNVTTILLIVPVTLVITDTMKINPIPFIITETMMSNIGGTATLIGDPPNIMIGSAVGLSFLDFVINLAPVVVVVFFVNLFILKVIYKTKMLANADQKHAVMSLDEKLAINDVPLLKKGGLVMAITIAGFMLHAQLGYESATIALFGASLFLLISKIDPEEILLEIEWTTIFFFAALFILVGALEDVGVIEFLAEKMVELTQGDIATSSVVILFGSSVASAFLDNIPFVATMIPLLQNFGLQTGGNIDVLWWSLALGACLGGNGTLVGASANVIASGIVEKHGKRLSFMEYFKVGFPLMLVSVCIAYGYIVIRYL